MTPTEARYISVIPNTPGAPTVITTETQSVKMTMIPSRGTTNRSVLKSSRRPSTESPTNTDQQEGRFDDDKKNSGTRTVTKKVTHSLCLCASVLLKHRAKRAVSFPG
jgi:hypothetical protein